jgi:GNAT superfamily N-acetyltransferase
MTTDATEGPPQWRVMAAGDLDGVHALSLAVHPDYPERAAVLAEKLALHPGGCFVLAQGGRIAGYCFSHPWRRGDIPPLDTLLGRLPADPTTHFVHDLTLDEALRGTGAGRAAVALILAAARAAGLSHLSLVAVNGRGPFWQAAGFLPAAGGAVQQAAAAKYGAGAMAMERVL